MHQWHAPLDPSCEAVSAFYEQIYSPEDYIVGAPYDDITEDWERIHRANCIRCQKYGLANIEVA